ncbi:18638_t:CDS:2, partial [Racocetra fulgida]
ANPRWYVQVDWIPYTNHYEIALLLFLVVDSYLSSQLMAQALTDDETKEAHIWILQQIKNATNSSIPQVIFINTDPTLVTTIQDEFPNTNALHYIFHIAQNIPLNLKNHLKDNYEEFVRDFFE